MMVAVMLAPHVKKGQSFSLVTVFRWSSASPP